MKIILVRHGETEENKQKIIQGHLHGTLSELGKEQARKLANRLKDEKIDVIISSDLNRAKHTAEEIAKFHPDVPFELDERLRERNWGIIQGNSRHDKEFWKKIKWEEIKNNDEGLKKLGVETLSEGKERITKFINELKDEDKTILIVLHGLLMRLLVAYLTNKSVEDAGHLDNTSITIFEFNESIEPEMKLFNCTKHLEE